MPTAQLLTVSKINALRIDIRRDIVFYAPFVDNMDFKGYNSITFVSANTTRNATWRDGGVRSVAQNQPRFEYSGETQRGKLIKTSSPENEVLTIDPANALHNGNTLFWVEEGVLKISPGVTNPFNSSGVWGGTDNVHIRDLLKFNRVLTAAEIAEVKAKVYPGL